jgi:hypothetical protein
MQAFNLAKEQEWNPQRHVEKILGEIAGGDYTAGLPGAGQIAPITVTYTPPKSISAFRRQKRRTPI